jgi:hypothetical protein
MPSGTSGALFTRVPLVPPPLPGWLIEADVDYYTSEFARAGFGGITDCPLVYSCVGG